MEKALSHMRLAKASLGDDVTFSRYVKIPGRKGTHGKAMQHKLPSMEHPAMREGRTYFRKSVKRPAELKNLLVSGHSNVKIGRDCRIGQLKGYWIYTLSFEERATCPRSCHHWQNCYGNSMPYAKRIDHRHTPTLEARLEKELDGLLATAGRRPGSPGIIIRLHALGDFFSTEYVMFWDRMLRKHPKLVIFGYTAWSHTTTIGQAVHALIDTFPGRAMMRFSNGGMRKRSTVSITNAEDCPPGAFVCPEQTGQFDACGKCGACWSTLKNVAFMAH